MTSERLLPGDFDRTWSFGVPYGPVGKERYCYFRGINYVLMSLCPFLCSQCCSARAETREEALIAGLIAMYGAATAVAVCVRSVGVE